jgi:hypothetical protein
MSLSAQPGSGPEGPNVELLSVFEGRELYNEGIFQRAVDCVRGLTSINFGGEQDEALALGLLTMLPTLREAWMEAETALLDADLQASQKAHYERARGLAQQMVEFLEIAERMYRPETAYFESAELLAGAQPVQVKPEVFEFDVTRTIAASRVEAALGGEHPQGPDRKTAL